MDLLFTESSILRAPRTDIGGILYWKDILKFVPSLVIWSHVQRSGCRSSVLPVWVSIKYLILSRTRRI
jgi:hypothetical protein